MRITSPLARPRSPPSASRTVITPAGHDDVTGCVAQSRVAGDVDKAKVHKVVADTRDSSRHVSWARAIMSTSRPGVPVTAVGFASPVWFTEGLDFDVESIFGPLPTQARLFLAGIFARIASSALL